MILRLSISSWQQKIFCCSNNKGRQVYEYLRYVVGNRPLRPRQDILHKSGKNNIAGQWILEIQQNGFHVKCKIEFHIHVDMKAFRFHGKLVISSLHSVVIPETHPLATFY